MSDTPSRGMHHLGLATHDMEATLDFYENVLGFPARVCEMIEPETGGTIRHAFLDIGQGEMIAFWLKPGIAYSSVGRSDQSRTTECSGNVAFTSSPVRKVLPRTSITRSSVPLISI